jgi:hypothetical protein
MSEQFPAPATVASDPELTDRDRNIFQQVAVEGRKLDDVAQTEQLSVKQTRRIVQHASRVFALRSFHHEAPHVRAMHLQRLEHQWQEAMYAWYRSQNEIETYKTFKKGPKAEPSIERTSVKQCGDVRYLEYARKLLGEIRQLGGVNDLSTGGAVYATVETLTLEQRTAEFHRIVATLRERARTDEADRIGVGPVAAASDSGGAPPAAADALAPPTDGETADVPGA